MKELSIEEKAKRYDEAIKVAKSNYETIMQMDDDCTFAKEGIVNTFHHMFPELKESDDEKIRKEIIESIKGNMSVIHKDKCIAWLEKQGEQKSTDKFEPKFKVGDWIISDEAHEDYRICKIIEVGNGNYKIESIYGYSGYNQYKVFDSMYKLWTIKDAKDGDVLAYDNGNICIFDGTVEEGIYPFAHCGITRYGFETCDRQVPFSHDNNVHPATKEQRELLFDKMKKADYEWDAEKKELKNIEQKPVDIEAIKAEYYEAGFEDGKKYCAGYENGQEYDGGKEYSQEPAEWSEKDKDALLIAIIALEDMEPDDVYAGYNMNFKEACERLKAIFHSPQPKQEWSEEDWKIKGAIVDYLKDCNLMEWATWLEKRKDDYELAENEDERIRNELIAFVEQSIHRGGGTPTPQEQENKWIAWLEKQGEKKSAEWSDEDKGMLERIIIDAEDKCILLPNEVDWLKNIKDKFNL